MPVNHAAMFQSTARALVCLLLLYHYTYIGIQRQGAVRIVTDVFDLTLAAGSSFIRILNLHLLWVPLAVLRGYFFGCYTVSVRSEREKQIQTWGTRQCCDVDLHMDVVCGRALFRSDSKDAEIDDRPTLLDLI